MMHLDACVLHQTSNKDIMVCKNPQKGYSIFVILKWFQLLPCKMGFNFAIQNGLHVLSYKKGLTSVMQKGFHVLPYKKGFNFWYTKRVSCSVIQKDSTCVIQKGFHVLPYKMGFNFCHTNWTSCSVIQKGLTSVIQKVLYVLPFRNGLLQKWIHILPYKTSFMFYLTKKGLIVMQKLYYCLLYENDLLAYTKRVWLSLLLKATWNQIKISIPCFYYFIIYNM